MNLALVTSTPIVLYPMTTTVAYHEWRSYCNENSINKAVVDYINGDKRELYELTPKVWLTVSDLLDMEEVPVKAKLLMLAILLGDERLAKFMRFFNHEPIPG